MSRRSRKKEELLSDYEDYTGNCVDRELKRISKDWVKLKDVKRGHNRSKGKRFK